MVSKRDYDIKYNAEQLVLMGDKVADIYEQLQRDLFFRTVRRLKERGTDDLLDNPYIWQMHALDDMHLLNDENIRLIAERSEIAEKELRRVIENEGLKVYEETFQQLVEDLGREGTTANHYDVQRSLQALADQTMNDINNVINTTLPQETQAMYKDVVEQTVAEVVTGLKAPQQAFRDTIYKWHERGFRGFQDKAGRWWNADTYARTVIKSTTYRTYRQMREAPAEEFGIDTFYYSIKSSAREMCAPLQHQVVTKGSSFTADDGTEVMSLLDYGYGTPSGCMGINCGHMMTPFIPGVNNLPDLPDEVKDLTPDEAIENANIESKQRAIEREIRKNKERLALAKELEDDEEIEKRTLRGRNLNDAMERFVNLHNLDRKRDRERYYNFNTRRTQHAQ